MKLLLLPAVVASTLALQAALARADADADAADEIQQLAAQGRLPDALERAALAVKSHPQDVRARFAQGVVLMDLRRDAEAAEVFTALAQDFPTLADPHNNLALLHARAGRWEAARAALEVALRNDPGHRLALENLGDVNLQLALAAWQAVTPVTPALARKLQLGRDLLRTDAPAATASLPR
jgi:Flp pilus assembly protein TadD